MWRHVSSASRHHKAAQVHFTPENCSVSLITRDPNGRPTQTSPLHQRLESTLISRTFLAELWLGALRLGRGAGVKSVGCAAGRRIRDIRSALVGRNTVLGLAFT